MSREASRFVVLVLAFVLAFIVGWLLVIGQGILLPIFAAVISVYVLSAAADAMGRLPFLGRLPFFLRRLLVLVGFTLSFVALGLVVAVTVNQLIGLIPTYKQNLETIIAQLADLVRALEGGRLMRRSVALADGRTTLVPAQAPAALSVAARELANTFGPEYRMLIIGAGQMSEYLATMALFSGFAVTVCDPREEYRGAWSVDGARVLADMPDDVVAAFRPDRRSCVVALTHDPKLDDLALLEALDTEAFYVGAIGSRRNNASRRERLKEHFGRTEADLARLRGPIGIYIGSKTPPEIAVSIMAEVLACKNGVATAHRTGSDVMAIEAPVAATPGGSRGAAPSRVVAAGSANA